MTQPPPTLPVEPIAAPMPVPFSKEWYAWLPTTHRMTFGQILDAAGCRLRGCRVDKAWDEEHGFTVFTHNGHPLNVAAYRQMQPPPQNDHEAYFRLVYDLHAEEDGKPRGGLTPPKPREDPAGLVPEDAKLVNRVYAERDMCVALVGRMALALGYKAFVAKDKTQTPEWENVVFVELPSGQVSWHVHEREMKFFAHLPVEDRNPWDGHDTQEKYRRVLAPWPWENR